MRKFSITGLFAFVMIVALVVALVIAQRRLWEKEQALEIANQRISEFKWELGYGEIVDDSKWIGVVLPDRYEEESKTRIRIYIPDGGEFNLYYAIGDYAGNEVFKNGRLLSPKPISNEFDSLVVVVEKRDGEGENDLVRVAWSAESKIKGLNPGMGVAIFESDWTPIPKWAKAKPPRNLTSVKMRRYLKKPWMVFDTNISNSNGEHIGLWIWLEEPNDGAAEEPAK